MNSLQRINIGLQRISIRLQRINIGLDVSLTLSVCKGSQIFVFKSVLCHGDATQSILAAAREDKDATFVPSYAAVARLPRPWVQSWTVKHARRQTS